MAEQERKKLSDRKLRAPWLSFSINSEIDKLKSEKAWLNGDRNAVTLQRDKNLPVVLISLRKSITLHEHKVEGPITLFILSGKINFIVGEDKINAKANDFIVLDKAISHDVEGERFKKIFELSNNYTSPPDGCNTYQITYSLLKEFEEDLHMHIHLENNILFPDAIELEKEMKL